MRYIVESLLFLLHTHTNTHTHTLNILNYVCSPIYVSHAIVLHCNESLGDCMNLKDLKIYILFKDMHTI